MCRAEHLNCNNYLAVKVCGNKTTSDNFFLKEINILYLQINELIVLSRNFSLSTVLRIHYVVTNQRVNHIQQVKRRFVPVQPIVLQNHIACILFNKNLFVIILQI